MEKYRRISRLGEGAHGVVFKAEVLGPQDAVGQRTRTPTKKRRAEVDLQVEAVDSVGERKEQKDEEKEPNYVAIKKIRLRNNREGLSREAIREIKFLQELDHPNIMKVLDVFNYEANINVVLEYMLSDLEAVIKSKEVTLTPADVKAYMRMILLGVEHCHQHWVLHRDIKPGNLLVAPDGTLKLADFGLAKIYGSPNRELSNQACTLWYRAPELLFGARAYGTGADMWSVACIFGELLIRQPMFPGEGELNQLSRIFALLGTPGEDWPNAKDLPSYTEFQHRPAVPLKTIFTAASEDALELLAMMFRFDPAKRPTATEALAHRYFSTVPHATPHDKLPKPPGGKPKAENVNVNRKNL